MVYSRYKQYVDFIYTEGKSPHIFVDKYKLGGGYVENPRSFLFTQRSCSQKWRSLSIKLSCGIISMRCYNLAQYKEYTYEYFVNPIPTLLVRAMMNSVRC
jgi:hypothetical protein